WRHGKGVARGDVLHGTQEAGRICSGKQLLWIGAVPPGTPEGARRSEWHLQYVIGRHGAPIPAAGGRHLRLVEHVFNPHGTPLSRSGVIRVTAGRDGPCGGTREGRPAPPRGRRRGRWCSPGTPCCPLARTRAGCAVSWHLSAYCAMNIGAYQGAVVIVR